MKLFLLALVFPLAAMAQTPNTEANFLDNDAFDPASPQAEAILQQYDQYYEAMTGESAYPTGKTADRGDIDPAVFAGTQFEGLLHLTSGCVRQACAVWAVVSKSSQKITIYVNGSPIGLPDSRTSTGMSGHGTPNFDKHPDGRIYQRYSSRTFPGGDYNGLGNMPYAVFIRGGYAIHGTPASNWSRLGRPASHGCIRVHPDTGRLFNQLVRQYGVSNTWITVH
jgi:lipoprotein-anchoring transpeptidase ErfK/SrfK